MSRKGWIGVDLDGTLATYYSWKGPADIGEPIELMVTRVRRWLAEGKEVRIFTARAYPLGFVPVSYHSGWIDPRAGNHAALGVQQYELEVARSAVEAIRAWCLEHIGHILPITCVKDYSMYELWDDRAIQVERNTGRRMDEHPLGSTTP